MRLGSPSFVKHCLMWHRGKLRKQPKITLEHLMALRYDLDREEQNMLLLRHPYLTVEQSHGHMKEFKDKHSNFNKCKQLQEMKFENYITLEDRLYHLKHQETWE